MATSSYANTLSVVEKELADVAMVGNPLYRRIEKSVAKDLAMKDGKFYTKGTVKLKNGFNFRGVAEGGYRPTHYGATVDAAYFQLYKSWGAIALTREEYETGALWGPNGSVNIESVQMQALMQDFAWWSDISLRGGNIGRISNANGAGSSGTSLVVNDARDFEVGLYIDGHTHDSSTATITDAVITAVDRDTNTLTIAAETWADNDDIVPMDSRAYMMNGLADLINDNSEYTVDGYTVKAAYTTYGGLSRATYPKWTSPIFQPAGADGKAAFKKGDFDMVIARAATKMREKPNYSAVYADAETCASIVDAFPVNTRTMDDTTVKVGSEGNIIIYSPLLKRGKLEVLCIPHYWRYLAEFVDEDDLNLRWTEPPHFVKNENGNILRWQGGDTGTTAADQFVGSYMVRWNLLGNPQAHAALIGISPGESFPGL